MVYRMVYNYIVTIKCCANAYTPRCAIKQVYDNLVKKLKGKAVEWSSTVSYELDHQHQRWHLHTIMQCGAKPFFAKYQRKGWMVDFTLFPENDLKKVVAYLHKDDQNEYELDQQDWLSRAHHNYMFVDDMI